MTENRVIQTEDIIYCYSGTGNSLAAAKQLGARLQMPVKLISAEMLEHPVSVQARRCIIIYPTYAYGLPVLVRRFIQKTPFQVAYLAILTTMGSQSGGSLSEAARLMKRRKQKTHFLARIKSVENYVHMFGFPTEQKALQRIELQQKMTGAIAEQLAQKAQSRRPWPLRPFSWFISLIFRSAKYLFALRYKVLDTCTACGICEKLCPCKAIIMGEKKGRRRPLFASRKCDHCQCCMQLCPQKSIKYIRIRPEGKRYRHPDVRVAELMKRD